MRTKGKVLALVIALSMVMSVASCKKDDEEQQGGPGGGEGPSASADYKNTYYSAKLVTLPRHTDEIYTFAAEDKAGIIGRSYAETTGNCSDWSAVYRLYLCNYEGQIEKESQLAVPSDFNFEAACGIGDGKLAATGGGYDYIIFDYDGNVIQEAVSDNTDYGCIRSIAKTDEGFVTLAGDTVRLYDSDGNVTDELRFDDSTYNINAVIEQNGEYYGYGMEIESFGGGGVMPASEAGCDVFFKLDFSSGTVEKHCSASDLGDIWINNWYGADYHNYYCADSFGNDLVKIDFANKTTVPLADKGNMLINPPSYSSTGYSDTSYKFIDETHFYRDYLYQGTSIDAAEIALISVDSDLNLADRTKITLQGYGVMHDFIINSAAYEYNTSQDQYFLKLDDLTDQYPNESDEQSSAIRTQLLAKYANGEAPDMFYGEFFDFDYMGENNLVQDISQYLDRSLVSDKMVRSDNKIYQVYAGYYLSGFFGKCTVFENNNISIDQLPKTNQGQEMFDMEIPSYDLMYNSVGSDLADIYRRGDLTHDNILKAVRFAIEKGVSEEEYENMDYSSMLELSDVGNGRVSLYDTSVGGVSTYAYMTNSFSDYPTFVGYPSIGGSIHSVYPECLMAVSATTPNAQACCDFIKILLSADVQRRICASGWIPVSEEVLNEYIDVLKHPDTCTREQKLLYSSEFITDCEAAGWCDNGPAIPLTDEMASMYLEQIAAVDSVLSYDWGLYLVTKEEINSYYTQGKTVEEVADALYSRYQVYAQENYG